jgi:hypothetical protein
VQVVTSGRVSLALSAIAPAINACESHPKGIPLPVRPGDPPLRRSCASATAQRLTRSAPDGLGCYTIVAGKARRGPQASPHHYLSLCPVFRDPVCNR